MQIAEGLSERPFPNASALRAAAEKVEAFQKVEHWRGKDVRANVELTWDWGRLLGGYDLLRGRVARLVEDRLTALITEAIDGFEADARAASSALTTPDEGAE